MACINIVTQECLVRNSGLSDQEIQDIIIPLLKNRMCKIEPIAIETEDYIRVEFQITFYKTRRKGEEHYNKYVHNQDEVVEKKDPMPQEQAQVMQAIQLLRRHYHI